MVVKRIRESPQNARKIQVLELMIIRPDIKYWYIIYLSGLLAILGTMRKVSLEFLMFFLFVNVVDADFFVCRGKKL